MQKRNEIVDEARRWVGTPYRHQHAIRGFGVDCMGLIRAVGEICEVLPWDDMRFEPFRGYGEQPSPRLTLGFVEAFFKPLAGTPQPGDIACIAWREGLPMHLALLADFQGRATLIHALRTKQRVVEHGFTAEWPSLVHSWWAFPGLEA